jgi:hypothetical protein
MFIWYVFTPLVIEYLYIDNIKISSKFVKMIVYGSNKVYIEKSLLQYVYNINGGWSIIVNYSM